MTGNGPEAPKAATGYSRPETDIAASLNRVTYFGGHVEIHHFFGACLDMAGRHGGDRPSQVSRRRFTRRLRVCGRSREQRRFAHLL